MRERERERERENVEVAKSDVVSECVAKICDLRHFSCVVACISVAIPFFLASMNSLFSKLVADKRIQGRLRRG